MKKILSLIIMVSVMISCQDQQDDGIIIQEPEYQILRISDNGAIQCVYSYPSVDENGNEIMLSAALVAWKPAQKNSSGTIKSVIIGCHITITSDKQCPTSVNSSPTRGDALIMSSFPTQASIPELRQSIVIMPDYEGYGITRDRVHPYLVQELTARQVADAAKYGLQLYKSLDNAQPLAKDWKTISMGFSQGGAVALATHKYIEQHALDKELHFAGSFCGDGPYDLMQTISYYLEDDGHSFDVETRHKRGTTPEPLVIPLLVKGMLNSDSLMNKHKVSDYLSKQFLDTGIMDWIEDKELNTDQIREKFYKICVNGLTASDGTYYSPEQMHELFPEYSHIKSLLGTDFHVSADLSRMFTPDFMDFWNGEAQPPVKEGNPYYDMATALVRNSLVQGWNVRHRIVFVHSKYDTTVPFSNYQEFSDHHPEAQIRFIPYGKEDHEITGTKLFISLLSSIFHDDFTWLFTGKQ